MSFPAPILPNLESCAAHYAQPHRPTFLDCQFAFMDLPSGSQPIVWSNEGIEGDPYSFPFYRSHGKQFAHTTAKIEPS